MSPPEIFDRCLRRLRRDRAARIFGHHDFLRRWMIEGIEDRLAAVRRTFADVLDLGCFDRSLTLPRARLVRCDAGHVFAEIQADEDRLPFAEASFDLIVSAGVLDTVNDLPGALIQVRRALRPDGLFLGAFTGAGSLPKLRAALRSADPAAARLHPQIDVRAAGDLLARAGFALPVADTEGLTVRYRSLPALVADLRGMAATNILADRTPMTRDSYARTVAAFADQAEPDGRISERFEVVFVTGWAPA